jgi:hypothetical protein
VRIALPARRYDRDGAALELMNQVEQRLEAMGDLHATIASGAPLTQPALSFGNTPEAEDGTTIQFSSETMPWSRMAANYFQVVGIPILTGRTFAAEDQHNAIVIRSTIGWLALSGATRHRWANIFV